MENTRTFSVAEITEIQIKSSLSQVNVMAGSGPDIVLRWTDTNRWKTAVEQSGKVLLVKNKAAVTLYGVYVFQHAAVQLAERPYFFQDIVVRVKRI